MNFCVCVCRFWKMFVVDTKIQIWHEHTPKQYQQKNRRTWYYYHRNSFATLAINVLRVLVVCVLYSNLNRKSQWICWENCYRWHRGIDLAFSQFQFVVDNIVSYAKSAHMKLTGPHCKQYYHVLFFHFLNDKNKIWPNFLLALSFCWRETFLEFLRIDDTR